MAIVNVTEKWSGAGIGRSDDGRTARKVFSVLTDAVPNDLSVVLDASGIPRLDVDSYPGDDWLRVSAVGPARAVGPMLYEVPVEYEREGDGDEETPLDADPEIRWDIVASTEAKDFDADGDAITNTVGERFDPAPTFEVVDRRLSYARNEASYDPVEAAKFDNVTNEDEFLGWEPGTVLCRPIVGESRRQGDLIYARTRYEFIFRKGLPEKDDAGGPAKAWYRRILNQGRRKRVIDENGWPALNEDWSPKYEEILDNKGNPLTEPVNLGADGKVLAEADPPHWIEVKQYGSKEFADLGIEIR